MKLMLPLSNSRITVKIYWKILGGKSLVHRYREYFLSFWKYKLKLTLGVDDKLWTTNTTGFPAFLMASTASLWEAFCKSTPDT